MLHSQIQHVKMHDFNNAICYAPEILNYYPDHFSWVDKCRKENREAIICQKDEDIIACSIIKTKNIEFLALKICFLYVVKKQRELGVGSELMNEIIAFAQDNHYKEIYLTVNEANLDMISFIIKWGFVKMGISENGDAVYVLWIKGNL
ncbi:MAG: GNAT family N-acetyltransferase [Bariatricus sp.]|nr:GNAT family N-acetyltransferase [Bariatricus sp.]MDY5521116.1 GNAT family N-acetyltransferase [Agathobacter sp.]